MRARSLLAIAVTAFTLTACADENPVSPTFTAASSFDVADQGYGPATPQRPIKLDFIIAADWSEGACVVSIPGGPTVPIPVLLVGTGMSSHKGKSGIEIRHLQCGFDPTMFVITFGGSFVDWGANGDRTWGTWSGHMVLFGEQAGYFFNTGEITGGTGRFENATGELDIQGWKNLADPTASDWFKAAGWISY